MRRWDAWPTLAPIKRFKGRGTSTVSTRWRQMRKLGAVALPVACLAVIAVYAGWAFHRGGEIGDGWTAVIQAWPYLLAGVLTVVAAMALFLWLAFYSDRGGYDERAGRDKPQGKS